VHVDEPRVGGVPVAPHLLEQHLAGEHLAGLRASATSRSNSSGVSEISWPSRVTRCPATSMSTSPIRRLSGSMSSLRRIRARTRATSSLGLNGLTM
jgi:hypothetical protein